jgi:hypothetical protein
MISVYLDPSSKSRLYAELDGKVDGIKELASRNTEKEMLDAAYSIAALKFIKSTNLLARSKKTSFHHVYEWGETGKETGRLFRLIKRNNGLGSATIYTKFNLSKKRSPISPILRTPGNSGRVVKTSGVFKNKAEVMESGKSVGFITTRTIAFADKNRNIVFVPAGKSITIRNPGGQDTSGSFSKHFALWWSTNFNNILDNSGVIKKIETNVARTLNRKGATRSDVRNVISSTLAQYKTIGSVV